MYIGPWQEFKLAKILQLKEKLDKQESEANQMTSDQNSGFGASSFQNGGTRNFSEAPGSVNSQNLGRKKAQQPVKATQQYKMDPAFQEK